MAMSRNIDLSYILIQYTWMKYGATESGFGKDGDFDNDRYIEL